MPTRLVFSGVFFRRNTCQNENVRSLEEVIKHLIDLTSSKAAAAQAQADIALENIEDLENDSTPEDIMLSYVTGDQSKDRTDRELVAPWFKFLWETYRSVLEILRNYARLEGLYTMTANRALSFCLQYKRTTEFRRLCDILRNHLKNLHDPQQHRRERAGGERPDITNPESLKRFLDTRFEQLRVAADLSMWQEAFRSIEDIYSLIETGKRAGLPSPPPSMMAVYYMRLTQIFTVSDSPLYLAFAWYKLLNLLVASVHGLPEEDKSALAAAAVLSALAVAPYDKRLETAVPDHGQERDRSLRMAFLLGVGVASTTDGGAVGKGSLPADTRTSGEKGGGQTTTSGGVHVTTSSPSAGDVQHALSRSTLVKDITVKHLLRLCPSPVNEIFELLEGSFTPIDICHQIQPLLAQLDKLQVPLSPNCPMQTVDLAGFTDALKEAAVLRMVRQLQSVYSVMKISTLQQLVPLMDFSTLERVIVDGARAGYIKCRVDHRKGIASFGQAAEASRLDDEGINGFISTLTASLRACVHQVNLSAAAAAAAAAVAGSAKMKAGEILPRTARVGVEPHLETKRQALFAAYLDKAEEENLKMVARKLMVEKRKEETERLALEMEREAEARRLEQEAKEREAEARRLAQERARREQERILAEHEAKEQEEARQLALERGMKLKGDERLDKNELVREAMREKQEKLQSFMTKIQRLEVTMDHLERARREIERDRLVEHYQKAAVGNAEAFKSEQVAFMEAHKRTWEGDLVNKKRLVKMAGEAEVLRKHVMTRRAAEFEVLRVEREKAIAEDRAARKEERARQRRVRYLEQLRSEARAEQRKKEEEAAAREAEEARAAAEASQRDAAGGGKFVPSAARRVGGGTAAPPPSSGGDRWGGSSASGGFGSRPPSAAAAGGGGGGGGGAAGSSGGAFRPSFRRDDGAGGAGGGGSFRPSFGGAGAAPPNSSRPTSAAPPSSAGGSTGGKWQPSWKK